MEKVEKTVYSKKHGSFTYTGIIYKKCVKCGIDKKDLDYHWCFKCFSEWEALQRVEKKSNDYLFSD